MTNDDNTIRGNRLATRTRLALALALGTAVSALAPPAQACGMGTFWEGQRSPPALLADANRALEQGRRVTAVLRARAILAQRRARPAQRSRAWAIIGWVRWQEGRRQEALDALARSRALDRTAIDFILAHAKDNASAAALTTALEG